VDVLWIFVFLLLHYSINFKLDYTRHDAALPRAVRRGLARPRGPRQAATHRCGHTPTTINIEI